MDNHRKKPFPNVGGEVDSLNISVPRTKSHDFKHVSIPPLSSPITIATGSPQLFAPKKSLKGPIGSPARSPKQLNEQDNPCRSPVSGKMGLFSAATTPTANSTKPSNRKHTPSSPPTLYSLMGPSGSSY